MINIRALRAALTVFFASENSATSVVKLGYSLKEERAAGRIRSVRSVM